MIRLATPPSISELVPVILERQDRCYLDQDYPHVAKNLAVFWGTDLFDQYLAGIVMADRPERQGFPYEVLRELRLVAEAHSAEFPQFRVGPDIYGNLNSNR